MIIFLSCFFVVQRQVRNERQRETKRERLISAPSDYKAPDSTSETVNSPDIAFVYGILKIKKDSAEKSKRGVKYFGATNAQRPSLTRESSPVEHF